MRADKLVEFVKPGSLWQVCRPPSKVFKHRPNEERWYWPDGLRAFTPQNKGLTEFGGHNGHEVTIEYGLLVTVLTKRDKNGQILFVTPDNTIIQMSLSRFTRCMCPMGIETHSCGSQKKEKYEN